MTDDPFDPTRFPSIQQQGLRRSEVEAMHEALAAIAARMRADLELDPELTRKKLAAALGGMGAEEFERMMDLPGDTGTEETDELVAGEGSGLVTGTMPGLPAAAEEAMLESPASEEMDFEVGSWGESGTDEVDD